jgi:antitoxin (DNA-binding transcriptional repressor) of toxin-antitoxin stability system
MAVIHISQEEAASNFAELIAKARAGEEVHIDEDVRTIAILRAPKGYEEPRLLSEIVAGFSGSSLVATIDPHFAADVEAGIRGHACERLIDPWESF